MADLKTEGLVMAFIADPDNPDIGNIMMTKGKIDYMFIKDYLGRDMGFTIMEIDDFIYTVRNYKIGSKKLNTRLRLRRYRNGI